MFFGIPQDSQLHEAHARELVASLAMSGLNVEWDSNIERRLWRKLAVNASINGLTALLLCRNGVLLESTHGLSLVKHLCAEVQELMSAKKLDTSVDVTNFALDVLRQTANNYSSMHADIIQRRATEIDYINGYVVQHGDLFNIPTPINGTILSLVKLKEWIS